MELNKMKKFIEENKLFAYKNYQGDVSVVTASHVEIHTLFINVIDDIEGVMIADEATLSKLKNLLNAKNEDGEYEFEGEIYDSLFEAINDVFGDLETLVQFTDEDDCSTPYTFECKENMYAFNGSEIVQLKQSDLEYYFAILREIPFNGFEARYLNDIDSDLFALIETDKSNVYTAIDDADEAQFEIELGTQLKVVNVKCL